MHDNLLPASISESILHDAKPAIYLDKTEATSPLFDIGPDTDLHVLFQAMNDIILVLTEEGRCCQVAPTNLPIWFRPAEQFVGRHIKDLFAPSEYQLMERCIQQAIMTVRPVRFEQRIHIGGTERWFGGMVTAIPRQSKIIWCARDISDQKKAEETIRESEKKYAALFEDNHEALLLIDPINGKIVDANPAACEFYGYSRPQITSMHIGQINTADSRRIFQAMKDSIHLKNRFLRFKHKLADGEIREVDVYSGPINVNGKLLLLSNVHDITEKLQQDKQLRESEKKMRAIFSCLTDLIVVLDKEGKCLDAAPTHMSLYLQSPADLIGQKVADFYPQHITNLILSKIQEALDHREMVRFEYSYTRGRSDVWRSASINPMDAQSVLLVSRDITAFKEAEMESMRSRDLFEQMPDMFPNPMWRTDREGHAVFFNPGWKEFIGDVNLDESPDAWLQCVHPDDLDDFLLQYLKSIYARQAFDVEFRLKRHDGEYRWLNALGSPFEDSKKEFMGYVVSCFDITERKQR
jgi:PAS domain S-box-containing protein